MDPGGPDQLNVLAVALVLLLPLLGIAWKAAAWRGDTFSKWNDRVDLAHAGLNERVKVELVAIQDDIADVLFGEVPAEIWIDPDPLVDKATRCAVLLKTRDKLRSRFDRYRSLGPILLPTAIAYFLGWFAATLYFTEVVHETWMKLGGFIIGGIAITAAVAIFCCRVYFESRLSIAEELSKGARH